MRRALLITVLACLAAPTAGLAAPSQESWFQDDNMLEFSERPAVTETLDRLKTLGVDRIRVSVFWLSVAPDGGSRTKPEGFDGSDPDAYPESHWGRYDTLVKLAAERGIGILWDVTGPSPAWALKEIKSRPDIADAWYPNANEFGAFVKAVATRYSGTFIRPADRPKTVTTPEQGTPGVPGYKPPTTTTTEPGPPLPRVDHWEIWNEPNQGAWLAPQHTRRKISGRMRWLPTSPRLYRRLADEMYASLVATGHAGDTILLGATAPKGSNDVGISRPMNPGLFIRELYCVDRNNQAYRGTAATVRGCPSTDAVTKVPERHPVLFRNTGFSHHPYELTFAPNRRPPEAGSYTMASLDRLSHTLRFAYLRYRQTVPSGGVPLYLSEYGYQTNPPDRIGVSLARQAAYLNQAEYLAWRNPAVRSHSQFLLEDGGEPISNTFQTGLLFADGKEKPAYQAYKLPIWLPQRRVRSGGQLRVWGLIRPAANGTAPQVAIQFKRNGSNKYDTLATRNASEARGYLFEKVRIPGSGSVRLEWQGQVSRSVSVSAR
ncbi:MAG: hypothetical protein WKF96_17945 [Solirubrobacteraceae bacterium]